MSKPTTKPRDKLTPKQRRFATAYLLCHNATQAAIEAGYSEKTARVTGAENLTKPAIVAVIENAISKAEQRTEVTIDRTLRELARLGFSDIRNVVRWQDGKLEIVDSDKLSPDVAAGILSIKNTPDGGLEIKMHPKLAALEQIARHLGMFNDKLQINHSYELKLPDDFPRPAPKQIEGEIVE